MTLIHSAIPVRSSVLAGLVAAALLLPMGAQAQGVLRIDGQSDVPLFGRHIMPLGDCDGDGVADYGVEAADLSGSIYVDRSLRVVSGASGAVLWSNSLINGDRSPSAATLGDVDGDGADDVVYAYQAGGASRVRIASGATGALIRELPNLTAGVINRVATFRDINGDGVLDVLVHSGGNASSSPGIFQLFSGATGARLNGQSAIGTQDAFLIDSPIPGEVKVVTRSLPMMLRRFDLTQGVGLDLELAGPDDWVLQIESVGDINGDGWGDVLCLSSTRPTPGPGASRVSVLSGKTLQVLWDRAFSGPTTAQRFVPENVVSVGDRDGDGVDDVGLALARMTSGLPNGRLVQTRSGRDGSILRRIESIDSFTSWAAELAPVGDLDSDGVPELGVFAAYSKLSPSGLGATSQVFIMRSREIATGMQGLEFCRAGPPNSSGKLGSLMAVGSATIPAGTLTFHASDLPPNAFGLLVVSADPRRVTMQPGSGLCLDGAIGRFRGPGQILQANGSGQASVAINASQIPLATAFVFPTAGKTFAFQLWHRDGGLGAGITSRFTSGLTVTFH